MRPDQATNDAFTYCLALAAITFNIGVVGFIANSNHYHAVVIDRDGLLPAFLHFFHTLFAKHQNCLRGRWENFWAASEQTSVVLLENPEDVLDKLAYTLTNPVKDHLVERAHHWPGASSLLAMRHDGIVEAARPRRFFDKDGELPSSAAITLCRAPGFENDSHEEYLARIETLIAQREQAAAQARKENGSRVLGRKAILNQHWDDRPKSHEPRRNLSPRVACRNQWARIERLQHNKAWLVAYRDCRERWASGDRNVLFPQGTYWLCRFAGARAQSPACGPPL